MLRISPVLKKSLASKVKRPEDIPVTKEFEELANIEDVRQGDYVLTRDEHTEKSSYRKVTELFRHEVKLLYRIVLSDGTRLSPRLAQLAPCRPTPSAFLPA